MVRIDAETAGIDDTRNAKTIELSEELSRSATLSSKFGLGRRSNSAEMLTMVPPNQPVASPDAARSAVMPAGNCSAEIPSACCAFGVISTVE